MTSASRFTPERDLLSEEALLTEAGRLEANAAPRARSQRLNLSGVAAGHIVFLKQPAKAVLAECLHRLAGFLGADKQLINSLGDVL